MNFSLEFFLIAFTSFITIINPLNVMPVFMTMTTGLGSEEKRKVATKALLTAFITMLIFAFAGQVIFKFFSITVDSFRVVGGILFFVVGWDMLQARMIRTKTDDLTNKEFANDIAITPLGIPMICGPGAITNSIILMEDATKIIDKATVIIAIILVLSISYLVLLSANKILKIIGETGNKVMMRIMGLIVMVFAVEFFFAGLRPILRGIFIN
jgi:multiple antibiotic resistance protein